MEIETGWHTWKGIIGRAFDTGRAVGISDRNLDKLAYHVGGILADHFDPANREQRLLKELWEQGDESERRALATLFARLARTYVSGRGPAGETGKPGAH